MQAKRNTVSNDKLIFSFYEEIASKINIYLERSIISSFRIFLYRFSYKST
jgi:hypothetical protein